MSTTTTPILVWKYESEEGPRLAIGERPNSVEATLVHKDNYADLIENDARMGGCSIRLFDTEGEARQYSEKVNAYGETRLEADYTVLPDGEAITLMHGPDLKQGFHSAMRTGRFDLRGSWGMTPDEIQALVPEAVETSSAPVMGKA